MTETGHKGVQMSRFFALEVFLEQELAHRGHTEHGRAVLCPGSIPGTGIDTDRAQGIADMTHFLSWKHS